MVIRTKSLTFLPLRHYSTPSYSASTSNAAASLAPARLIYACSHHRIPTCAPNVLFNLSHRYIIDYVAMYCATVLCHRLMYCSIICNPASSLAIDAELYSHFLSVFCCLIRPVRRCATWSWKSPITLPIRGVTTQVSDPNRSIS